MTYQDYYVCRSDRCLVDMTPWLTIPLEDYEGHMSLPAIGQAQMIAERLDSALVRWSPRSAAVIGCAGGNGLDKIEERLIERVVALDVNPNYTERTRTRYANRLPRLEIICADVQSESLTYDPVDFTYAALLFEYVDAIQVARQFSRCHDPGRTQGTVPSGRGGGLHGHRFNEHRAVFRKKVLCASLQGLTPVRNRASPLLPPA